MRLAHTGVVPRYGHTRGILLGDSMITCPHCHEQLNENAQFCGNCGQSLASQTPQNVKDAFVGKCIDKKYYVRERIAAGGMGEVYLAIQKPACQEVAIKKLHEEYYRDKVAVERFMNEAHSYARITHPNAVKLYDLLNIHGQICIVMEFVHGKTLTAYIESGYLFSTRQIIDISLQIADALATVHQAGIIHRDLKTENIMLMETVPGRFSVKILDFGIAKIKGQRPNQTTKEGILVGTPEFMSPEQCYGQDIDYRSDIYSFGILLFVMVCCKLPFTADTAIGLLQKQVSEPTPPCSRPDHTEVPQGLEAIIRKCMEKIPDQRYQSFADVITDLEYMQEHRETSIAIPLNAIDPTTPNDSRDNARDNARDITLDNARDIAVAPPHSDDFQFSLEGERCVTLDDFSLSDEPIKVERDELDVSDDENDDHYSLGDISEIDEERAITHHNTPQKSHHGVLLFLLFLLLILGAGLFILHQNGQIDFEKLGIPIPNAIKSEITETPTPQPAPDTPQPEAATDPVAHSATQPSVPNPTPQAVEPNPVPPCSLVTHAMLEQSVAAVMLDRSESQLNAAKWKDANLMFDRVRERKNNLTPEQITRLNGLTQAYATYQSTLQQAEKAAKRENCSAISSLVTTLPENAIGVRAQIEKIARKCLKDLESPPDAL